MKILKKVDYSDWRYRFICGRCTSELEAEPADVHAQYRNAEGNGCYTFHCACPVCNNQLTIPKEKISGPMQYFLQEKARASFTSGGGKD